LCACVSRSREETSAVLHERRHPARPMPEAAVLPSSSHLDLKRCRPQHGCGRQASLGIGSPSHLAGELFKMLAGVDLILVRRGCAEGHASRSDREAEPGDHRRYYGIKARLVEIPRHALCAVTCRLQQINHRRDQEVGQGDGQRISNLSESCSEFMSAIGQRRQSPGTGRTDGAGC
jgi:hypothetical protein